VHVRLVVEVARIFPFTSLPAVAATAANPYGLTSPLAGTVGPTCFAGPSEDKNETVGALADRLPAQPPAESRAAAVTGTSTERCAVRKPNLGFTSSPPFDNKTGRAETLEANFDGAFGVNSELRNGA
jgi:hypothetical protein